MPDDNPLSGILFGKKRVIGAFPVTQEEAIEKAKEFEERLHPRDPGGKFAPKGGGGKGAAPRQAAGRKKRDEERHRRLAQEARARRMGISPEWVDRMDNHQREMDNIAERLLKKPSLDLRTQFMMHNAARNAAMRGRKVTEADIRHIMGADSEALAHYDKKYAPKKPEEKPEEKPKAAPKTKKPEITIKSVKSEAESLGYDLTRERVKRRDGHDVGKVTVDDVTETPKGVEIYMFAEDLKIGGVEDEDSNDYEAQGKLLEIGLKNLKKKFPRKKMHAIGGEKGYFGFFIEDKRPKRAFDLQVALRELLGRDKFYWPKNHEVRTAMRGAQMHADGTGDVAKLEAALQGIVDAWGDKEPERFWDKEGLKKAKNLLRRKKV